MHTWTTNADISTSYLCVCAGKKNGFLSFLSFKYFTSELYGYPLYTGCLKRGTKKMLPSLKVNQIQYHSVRFEHTHKYITYSANKCKNRHNRMQYYYTHKIWPSTHTNVNDIIILYPPWHIGDLCLAHSLRLGCGCDAACLLLFFWRLSLRRLACCCCI